MFDLAVIEVRGRGRYARGRALVLSGCESAGIRRRRARL
jgi:hypothetical protein